MKLTLPLNSDCFTPEQQEALRGIISMITGGWGAEHLPDGRHNHIAARGNVIAQGYAAFVGMPVSRLLKSAAQTLATATTTRITWSPPTVFDYTAWPSSGYIAGGMEIVSEGGVSNNGLGVPYEGYYHCQVQLSWASFTPGAGTRGSLNLRRSSDSLAIARDSVSLAAATADPMIAGCIIGLRKGERVYVEVTQDTGSNADVGISTDWLAVHKLF